MVKARWWWKRDCKGEQPARLLPAIGQVREQVAKVFGQGGILLEECISGARHIEVQFVVNQNEAFALGIRDCSIQRKNQKIIEELLLFAKDINVLCDSQKSCSKIRLQWCWNGRVSL